MLGCVRSGRTFNTHIRNDRRNPATLEKHLLRLGAGDGGLDIFHGGGGHIVFRAQSDDGATSMKNISNELESGSAFQAGVIYTERDVVDVLDAMRSLGHHALLEFCPASLVVLLMRV